MSRESVQKVIARAITDGDYRDLLFTDPERALTGYALSEQEVLALEEVDRKALVGLIGSVMAPLIVPFRVGRRTFVAPAWFDSPTTTNDVYVHLDQSKTDAGLSKEGLPQVPYATDGEYQDRHAFGSGTHATTRLTLGALEDHIQLGDRVLDLGTGSGILAIAAAKLGAATVLALDIDAASVEVARKNVALNKVDNIVRVEQGSLDLALVSSTSAGRGPWETVVANLLTDIIVTMLRAGMADTLQPGGTLIVSGILRDEADEVWQAIRQAELIVSEERQLKEWVAIVTRRPVYATRCCSLDY